MISFLDWKETAEPGVQFYCNEQQAKDAVKMGAQPVTPIDGLPNEEGGTFGNLPDDTSLYVVLLEVEEEEIEVFDADV